MTDAALALAVACAALAVGVLRLSLVAVRSDPTSPERLVAELRLAQFGALVLALTAGAYVGFSLAQAPTPGSGADIALAVGFLMLAWYAITQEPGLALTLVAGGFAAHAGLDLLHGAGVLPSEPIPTWFTTACAIYDVAVAGVCYLPIVRR